MQVPQPTELLLLLGDVISYELQFEMGREAGRINNVLHAADGGPVASLIQGRVWARVNCTLANDLPDCFRFAGSQFIVSTAFKDLVERYDVPKTEFVSLSLILRAHGTTDHHAPWKDGDDRADGYWLMNCWNRVDAIDAEKSDAQDSFPKPGKSPTRIFRYKKLVFKAALDQHLFGFEKHLVWNRYVSASFRDAIDKAGLKAPVVSRRTTNPDRNVRGDPIE